MFMSFGTRRIRQRFNGWLPGAAALLVAFWSIGGTAAGSVSPVSGSDPYATSGCESLDTPQEALGSINYLNSTVEPDVAVDPTNSMHLVGAWQQDRWSGAGAHGLVAAYSTDGGATWTPSPLPFSVCYGASGFSGAYLNYQRASDPWVSIGPGAPGDTTGNTVYAASISFDQTPYTGDPNAQDGGVGAAVSYDGGKSWTHVTAVIADPCVSPVKPSEGFACNSRSPDTLAFDDKESVTADPTRPGVAYMVWDRLLAPPAAKQGFLREKGIKGDAYFSKTTDFGQTWSVPRPIVSLASRDQTIGNVVIVNPNTGDLYDFFAMIQGVSNSGGNRGATIAFVKSSDAGATWSKPHVVTSDDGNAVLDTNNVNPLTGASPAPSRTGSGLPSVAINPVNGQLYVAWEDGRFNSGNDESLITTSGDGGATWSTPELVNPHNGEPAFNPTVYVNPDGTAAVTYYQFGNTVPGNEPTDVFIVHATNAGSSTTPPTFDTPTIVDGPFNNLAAPFDEAGGYFLGDYEGLTYGSGGWTPFYVKSNCSDGNATTEPSCAAIKSVLSPPDPTPTGNNSTSVYAAPGS
jgi:hypothetical protein